VRLGKRPRNGFSTVLVAGPARCSVWGSVAAQDLARDLAEIAAHIGQLKGDANAYLTDPNYSTLRLRLENAHATVEAAMVEARRRVRLNESRWARG
jgi:hypothetical protein